MLRSDLCDYSDAYIVVKGTITVARPNNNTYGKKLAFKNNAPFNSCITKINNTLIDNAEDLDIVMPMYNLIEYSKNYRKTTGSLWNYYRHEPNSGSDGVGNNNSSIKDSKSFDYKTSITRKIEGNNVDKEEVEIVVPLKYLDNFWRTLDMSLINSEVSLTLTWSENCVLQGWRHWGGGEAWVPCPHPHFLCSKKKKGKQRKPRNTFKSDTIKRLSLRSKLYCLSHSRASRIQTFFLSDNHGGRQYFSVFHGPSTLKSISPTLY